MTSHLLIVLEDNLSLMKKDNVNDSFLIDISVTTESGRRAVSYGSLSLSVTLVERRAIIVMPVPLILFH